MVLLVASFWRLAFSCSGGAAAELGAARWRRRRCRIPRDLSVISFSTGGVLCELVELLSSRIFFKTGTVFGANSKTSSPNVYISIIAPRRSAVGRRGTFRLGKNRRGHFGFPWAEESGRWAEEWAVGALSTEDLSSVWPRPKTSSAYRRPKMLDKPARAFLLSPLCSFSLLAFSLSFPTRNRPPSPISSFLQPFSNPKHRIGRS